MAGKNHCFRLCIARCEFFFFFCLVFTFVRLFRRRFVAGLFVQKFMLRRFALSKERRFFKCESRFSLFWIWISRLASLYALKNKGRTPHSFVHFKNSSARAGNLKMQSKLKWILACCKAKRPVSWKKNISNFFGVDHKCPMHVFLLPKKLSLNFFPWSVPNFIYRHTQFLYPAVLRRRPIQIYVDPSKFEKHNRLDRLTPFVLKFFFFYFDLFFFFFWGKSNWVPVRRVDAMRHRNWRRLFRKRSK